MGEEVVWSREEELDARADSEMEVEVEVEVEVEEEEEEVETGDDTEKKEKTRKRKKNRGRSSSGVVRWEKFLKRMTMRVLLVEADDSTRQIIAALLRKCSYRVAAVSDGLKAWEILKGRPHCIDLILTEVDLPSISGYALLTLMMEHEISKNIPVIMMSTQDSVSTVYKCMLKGAADYLVKPIRRNELRNLWQHVWRRQSLNVDANNHQDESVGQQEVDANSEDNAASNHSSRQMAGRQGSDEHVENGSDTQSSCTRPELEVEKSPKETLQEFSESNWGKLVPSDVVSQKGDACINMGQKMFVHEIGAGGTIVDTSKDDITARFSKDKPETQEDANATNEACDSNYVFANSSREAMDLIGAFHDHPNSGRRGTGIGEFDSFPQLDLSLKRSHPCGFWTESPEERRTLGHSNSSAFTRYTSRPLQPPQTKVVNLKENGTTSEKLLSNIVSDYSSDTNGMTRSTQRSVVTLAQCQSKESEVATSCSQLRVFPVPVPVKGVRVNNLCSGYGSVLPPIFCTSSGPLPTPSPSSFALQEPSFQVKMLYQSNVDNSNFDQHHDPHSQNTNSVKQTISKQEHKLDSLEDRGHISPATDQSASSSFCNGGVNCYSNIGYGSACGSNSNVDNVPFYGAASENKNEEGLLTPTGSSHRSTQREAALTKFRLKRKERCYEKKVRYESRKKLAEQRPRIKGQFVRQVHTDPPTAETYGNSFDG